LLLIRNPAFVRVTQNSRLDPIAIRSLLSYLKYGLEASERQTSGECEKGEQNVANRGVVYLGPGKVEVQSIDDPKMQNPRGKAIEHGVILKIVSTNICGSDQHMVRGRTTAPKGLVLGHEITGEVIEKGKDVEFIDKGDLVSVPFNVACGRCRTCRDQHTGVCLNVNPSRAGGAYGYVDMGGWIGGQAQYVLVPYADFNLLKFPDKQQALSKIRDLTMLSDILPTGFHGAVTAGVGVGSTVYVAGAGPVGLAAAASAQILGAAVVMIGDMNDERLKHAKNVGFEPIDLRKSDKLEELIEQVVGVPEVDASIDAVGFEARGHGSQTGNEAPATVLNSLMTITRAAGAIGIPGLYVTEDPGSKDEAAKQGNLRMRFGLGWAKSHRFSTGQTPVLRYNRQLMQAILHDRLPIAKIVNATIITLDEAPQGYENFDKGAAKKYVLDPHGLLKKSA
jgi:glutathione-independent formaldehyde dehydrogenase